MDWKHKITVERGSRHRHTVKPYPARETRENDLGSEDSTSIAGSTAGNDPTTESASCCHGPVKKVVFGQAGSSPEMHGEHIGGAKSR